MDKVTTDGRMDYKTECLQLASMVTTSPEDMLKTAKRFYSWLEEELQTGDVNPETEKGG